MRIQSPSQSDSPENLPRLLGLVLILLTLALYWPVRHFEFVNLDDPVYVYDNPAVQKGLGLDGVVWAFSGAHEANWHPLTWLSHMLDCQLFGLSPGDHHYINVLFHAAAGAALFLALAQMTGARWRSLFVAAVFLWHPLRVESVAWISERKDVLSGLCFMLTLWTYARYVQNKKLNPPRATLHYRLALLSFTLGLLSKSMLVTLPAVLLLLDYWPLRRTESWRELFREKIPFLVLTATVSVITFLAQEKGGAIASVATLPLAGRLANLPVAYLRYLGKILCPQNLSVMYLTHVPWPPALVLAAVLILAAISALAVYRRKSNPWLFVGWFWFAGMLVPVSGLIQVGQQSMADRYSYLPGIGITIAVTWLACEIFNSRNRPFASFILGGLGVFALAACCAATSIQLTYWENSGLLMQHAIDLDPKNAACYYTLGTYLHRHGNITAAKETMRKGIAALPNDVNEAIQMGTRHLDDGQPVAALPCFRFALLQRPDYEPALACLGETLRQLGQFQEANEALQKALTLNATSYQTHYAMAKLLEDTHHAEAALAHYQNAAQLQPASGLVQAGWATGLIAAGHPAEAPGHFQAALKLEPNNISLRQQVARGLLQMNALEEALNQYREILRQEPDFLPSLKDLAWLLATGPRADLRDGPEAVQLAEHACQLTGYKNTLYTGLLDAAYAEAGRLAEAITAGEKARELYLAAGDKNLAALTTQRLELYRAGKKYHVDGR